MIECFRFRRVTKLSTKSLARLIRVLGFQGCELVTSPFGGSRKEAGYYCFSKQPRSGKPAGLGFPSKSIEMPTLVPLLIAGEDAFNLKS